MGLVLTRKVSEIIVIGSDITIMVVSVRGDSVRLNITAPESVPINRLEVQRSKDNAKLSRKGN